MKEADPSSKACLEVRERLDAFLDGELPAAQLAEVETHLSGCKSCEAEVGIRTAVKRRILEAVRGDQLPQGLEGRVRGAIQARQDASSRGWHRSWMRIAAGVVLVALAAAGGWQLKLRFDQERMIDELSAQVATVFGVGLGDHLHCAKFRESKHPWVQELIEKTLVEPLGPEYEGVRRVVAERLPEGFEIWMAHRCRNRGRRFIHVALRGEGKLLSVILTRKEPGESFRGSEGLAGPPLQQATAGEFQLAGFESGGHLVFVISDLSAAENGQVARSLGEPLDLFLKSGSV